MTIPYCIQIGVSSLSSNECTRIEETIEAVFAEIHSIYDNWNPASEISQLNQLHAFQKKEISEKLACFLKKTDLLFTATDGRFDPTIEPLQKLWKTSLNKGEIPSEETCQEYKTAIGWQKIHLARISHTFSGQIATLIPEICRQGGEGSLELTRPVSDYASCPRKCEKSELDGHIFWKEHDQTALDFGGIAKGYAVDLLFEKLQEEGFKDIYIEWGGEIRACGKHPSNRPWKIGIQGLAQTLELNGRAVATSGSYIQNWTIDGQTYTHIIDPKSAKPLCNAPYTSVTVLAETCTEADALATALMQFPSIEAAKQWAKQRHLQVFIW